MFNVLKAYDYVVSVNKFKVGQFFFQLLSFIRCISPTLIPLVYVVNCHICTLTLGGLFGCFLSFVIAPNSCLSRYPVNDHQFAFSVETATW